MGLEPLRKMSFEKAALLRKMRDLTVVAALNME